MKKILTLMLLLSTLTFGQTLDKLEQSYLSKAETLQAGRDKDVKERDAKLAKDSKRLAEAYLRSLKIMLKAETQKGDFDSAIKVKAKITEMEAMLKDEPEAKHRPKPAPPKPLVAKPDTPSTKKTLPNVVTGRIESGEFLKNMLIGRKYQWVDKTTHQITFLPNGVFRPNWSSLFKKWRVKGNVVEILTSSNIIKEQLNFTKGLGVIYRAANQQSKVKGILLSKTNFYKSVEQLVGTTWLTYSEGKPTGGEITLLAAGKFKVTGTGWRSHYRWGYKDGDIIFGASTIRGQEVTFSINGQKTINHFNISNNHTYPNGYWKLKGSSDPIVGTWNWVQKGKHVSLKPDGSIVHSGSGGTWTKTGTTSYLLKFVTNGRKYPHTVTLKGNVLNVEYGRHKFTATRVSK